MAKARSSTGTRDYPLPPGVAPIGVSRTEAAWLVGVSPNTYDAMVKDGRMPKPKRIGSRTIWDRYEVERAFREIPGDDATAASDKDPWGNLVL
ncbi:helix-turn-helix transcriptional regulator [Methylobacterium sp. CM6244]